MSKYFPYLMIFIAFLAFNCAVGLTYGVVGLLIEPLSTEFAANKSQVSLSISLVAAISACASPLVGRLLDRWSLRGTMLIGCLLGIAAYFGASRADSIVVFLLAFGVLGGLSFAMLAVVPANKIVSLWFPDKLGRMSGLVNLGAINALAPPLFGYVIINHGWRALLEGFALVYIGMLLLCLLVRAPAKTAQAAELSQVDQAGTGDTREQPPFKSGLFWLICAPTMILATTGIVAITFVVAFAQEQQIPATSAALLLSVLGIASLVGAPLFGWLCDRLSPLRALLLNGGVQLLLWCALAGMTSFTGMAMVLAVLGLCTGGVMPMLIALIGRAWSMRRFGTALGQMTFAGLPLSFSQAPMAGLIYDSLGSFRVAFLFEAALCVLALLVLWFARGRLRVL